MTDAQRKAPLDLQDLRSRLRTVHGPHYWRSLEALAETPAFQELLHREFPRGAAEWDETFSRRTFLKLMGASLALAGVTGCVQGPQEQIAPYTRQPETIVPGIPQVYASTFPFSGFGQGVIVESHMGRPTKIEGNPDHPDSLGATNIFGQASILTMYDPDRASSVRNQDRLNVWDNFRRALLGALEGQRATQGAGLRLLTETVTSPTLANQIQTLLTQFPAAVWHQYEPVNDDNQFAGTVQAFGSYVQTRYDFAQANVILSLDDDFLGPRPGQLQYARGFTDRRRVSEGAPDMNRLYVAEGNLTITGAMADHRLPLRPSQIEVLARAVAAGLGVNGVSTPPLDETQRRWVDAVLADLEQNRGASIVIAGRSQPPLVHTLAHAMNALLGNVGQTVLYTAPVASNPINQNESLIDLVNAMDAGTVELLVIIGGNPVYNTPADLRFGEKLAKVPFSTHLSLYYDETAQLTTWHIPEAYYLESWSDIRAFDGTVSIIQPLIAPLYNGKTPHELLATLIGQEPVNGYAIVRDYWRSQQGDDNFDQFWRIVLAQGLLSNTALQPITLELQAQALQDLAAVPEPAQGLELIFQPDPTVWDGSYANNGWLQELSKNITKLTWDNAALISPATAARLGLASEDLVELRYRGSSVRAPIWIVPGHIDDAVTVTLGYGRSHAGNVGNGQGFNAYLLRKSDAPWFDAGLEIQPLGERYFLANTQDHGTMEGRDMVRAGTLAEFRQNPEFIHEASHSGESLFGDYDYPQAWGMVINLNTCIGCNTCTIACQAENNIPVVGKDQVLNAREMHWIMVDRYYAGDMDNPSVYFQPRPCMHCETAPCELVCPVAATLHDSYNGLNAMVYNRCVGTRYCSNNCPYKVRRFNFLQYNDPNVISLQLMRNPNVTVRNRGVMEKCTYCVQRINAARIAAEQENRPIRDGEVIPACAQACPTEAIIFGDLKDPNTRVARLRSSPLNYSLLEELNTQPRTTYVARLHNPNPALADDGTSSG